MNPIHGPIDPYEAGKGGTIGELVRYGLALVRRNIIPIALIMAAMVAIAVVTTMLDTPRYTATATIQINDQSENVLGEELDSESNVNSGWDVDRFLNTQLEILKSRDVALRVANALDLYEDEAFYAAMEVELPAEGMTRAIREDLTVGLLRGNMSSDLPRESRIARISFTSANPDLSARIANEFATQFIQSSLQRRYDSSSYAREFISEQLGEARAQLETSERELNAYARQAGLIRGRGSMSDGDTTSNSVTASSLVQLNEAANRARAERIELEARWRAEAAQPLLSSTTVLANPTVQSLMTERARIDSQVKTLRARYLDDYPEIVELQTQREELTNQIRSVAQSVRDGVRGEYLAASEAERQLRNQVGALQGDTLAEQDRSVRYNTLAREADTARSIYEGLLQRFRELNASAGIANSNLSIVDTAQIPTGQSSPNLFKNLLIALLLGAMLSAAYVFLRDQLDDLIRIPEDVQGKVKLPLLGVIPVSDEHTPEEDMLDPKSPMSEAYNSLRGQLLYSTADGLPKVLLVTSSQPSEGKSTTSNAIAYSLARMGKRVVLIDADLRRPSEHKRHSLPNKHGLSGLLTGVDTIGAETVHEVAENLSVITSGPIPPSPTELLAGPRLAGLLEELSASFECIILDSPPILGLADAPVISGLADGVLFVIESDRGRAGQLRTALQRLRAMDPVILGAVLTKFDSRKGANLYSEYYGYEYYRYQSSSDGTA
ncbi:GumC family protein [Croceicoccus sediminis]|uniref:GumC family protein n=1 Tax=Croceicoccus sediminis TaxID=2571150 RepID=UPI001182F5C3|nr:polysaccharide biosynthesis tyrosine autokinase [Croceicoccus sediminis]